MSSVGFSLLTGSALLVATPQPRVAPPLSRYEASRMSMACAYTIVAYGPDAAALPRVVEAAFDEVDRIDGLMSHYKPESPLSRLNREAARGPVPVEPELFDFIAKCLSYSRQSQGAFDITVGPLMKAWGFFQGEGRVPDDLELGDLKSRIGWEHVAMDPVHETIGFDRPGVELDLGGIAKGYAVDRVVSLLRRQGVAAALVSAGGSTLFGLGSPPGSKGWDVSVEDPIDPSQIALNIRLKDRALSVSGSAYKSFEKGGTRYSHVMDTRTRRPVTGMLSVAVLTGTGEAGDALDNAFFVLGVESSRQLLKELPKTEVFFFQPEGGKHWKLTRLKN